MSRTFLAAGLILLFVGCAAKSEKLPAVTWHTDREALDILASRAESVRTYLIKKGVTSDRMVAKGYGENVPIADNRTAAGRAQNRRVFVCVTLGGGKARVPHPPLFLIEMSDRMLFESRERPRHCCLVALLQGSHTVDELTMRLVHLRKAKQETVMPAQRGGRLRHCGQVMRKCGRHHTRPATGRHAPVIALASSDNRKAITAASLYEIQPQCPPPTCVSVGQGMQLTVSNGFGNYAAGSVKIEKRYSHGLQFITSYTWSHGMANAGTTLSGRAASPVGPWPRRSSARNSMRPPTSSSTTESLAAPAPRST